MKTEIFFYELYIIRNGLLIYVDQVYKIEKVAKRMKSWAYDCPVICCEFSRQTHKDGSYTTGSNQKNALILSQQNEVFFADISGWDKEDFEKIA